MRNSKPVLNYSSQECIISQILSAWNANLTCFRSDSFEDKLSFTNCIGTHYMQTLDSDVHMEIVGGNLSMEDVCASSFL